MPLVFIFILVLHQVLFRSFEELFVNWKCCKIVFILNLIVTCFLFIEVLLWRIQPRIISFFNIHLNNSPKEHPLPPPSHSAWPIHVLETHCLLWIYFKQKLNDYHWSDNSLEIVISSLMEYSHLHSDSPTSIKYKHDCFNSRLDSFPTLLLSKHLTRGGKRVDPTHINFDSTYIILIWPDQSNNRVNSFIKRVTHRPKWPI